MLCCDGDDCRDFVKIWIWDLVSFSFFAGHAFVLCFSKVIREISKLFASRISQNDLKRVAY